MSIDLKIFKTKCENNIGNVMINLKSVDWVQTYQIKIMLDFFSISKGLLNVCVFTFPHLQSGLYVHKRQHKIANLLWITAF